MSLHCKSNESSRRGRFDAAPRCRSCADFDPARLADRTAWPGSTVHHCARQLIGAAGLTASDLDDLVQELAIHVLKQWPKFDPDRAGATTFLDRILRQRQREILRQRRSPSQQRASVSLTKDLFEDRRRHSDRDHIEEVDREHDVASFLAALPSDERRVAIKLMRKTVAQIAREEGCHRQRVYESIGRIRKRLEDSALKEYLC